MERAGHLKNHASKALAMHMADEVWNGVQRHLFPDATGHRFGRPKTGRWYDFTRIPGRARSHTTANKWETFRLVGTLHGHAMAYTSGGQHEVQQPRRIPKPTLPAGTVPTGKVTASGKPGMRKATWWDHTGPWPSSSRAAPTATPVISYCPCVSRRGLGSGRGWNTSSQPPAAATLCSPNCRKAAPSDPG
ncbi:hypothetical protein SAZ11_20550 [Streptomyces sp. FXJ1.4098]|nr:hypothetical protein [Streptomyces sp. FXJ1.4098]